MSPVPWRIVKLEKGAILAGGEIRAAGYRILDSAPPEVIPAVWTHKGCETCGGSGEVWSCGNCGPRPGSGPMWCDAGCGRDYNTMTQAPCPDGRLVPWKGEEE